MVPRQSYLSGIVSFCPARHLTHVARWGRYAAPVLIANVILLTLAAYIAIGVAFGLYFVFKGIARIDPAAAHAGIAFRLLMLPGAVGLWPWLLIRLVRAKPIQYSPRGHS
jgi:hypothetical protein